MNKFLKKFAKMDTWFEILKQSTYLSKYELNLK